MQDSYDTLLADQAVFGQIDALIVRIERGHADHDDVSDLCELVQPINPGLASFLRINLANLDMPCAKFATAMLTVWVNAKMQHNNGRYV